MITCIHLCSVFPWVKVSICTWIYFCGMNNNIECGALVDFQKEKTSGLNIASTVKKSMFAWAKCVREKKPWASGPN